MTAYPGTEVQVKANYTQYNSEDIIALSLQLWGILGSRHISLWTTFKGQRPAFEVNYAVKLPKERKLSIQSGFAQPGNPTGVWTRRRYQPYTAATLRNVDERVKLNVVDPKYWPVSDLERLTAQTSAAPIPRDIRNSIAMRLVEMLASGSGTSGLLSEILDHRFDKVLVPIHWDQVKPEPKPKKSKAILHADRISLAQRWVRGVDHNFRQAKDDLARALATAHEADKRLAKLGEPANVESDLREKVAKMIAEIFGKE